MVFHGEFCLSSTKVSDYTIFIGCSNQKSLIFRKIKWRCRFFSHIIMDIIIIDWILNNIEKVVKFGDEKKNLANVLFGWIWHVQIWMMNWGVFVWGGTIQSTNSNMKRKCSDWSIWLFSGFICSLFHFISFRVQK